MRNFVLASLIICLACNNKTSNENREPFSLDPIYYQRSSSNGNVSYVHYIVLLNYSSDVLPELSLIEWSKNYHNNCKNELPIKGLVFLKSAYDTGFEVYEPRFDEINEQTLFSVYLEPDSTVFKIRGIGVTDGAKKAILNIE